MLIPNRFCWSLGISWFAPGGCSPRPPFGLKKHWRARNGRPTPTALPREKPGPVPQRPWRPCAEYCRRSGSNPAISEPPIRSTPLASRCAQRSVTAAAFAPARLNDPAAIGDVMTGLVLGQTALQCRCLAWSPGCRSAQAAQAASEQWTRASTAMLVYRQYWGAVLAVEQVRTLEAAAAAAQAHVNQAESLVRQGMATRSDALLASVKAGETAALLLRARSDAGLARRSLAVLMGDPSDTVFTVPDSLPGGERVRVLAALAAGDSAPPAVRADVIAAKRARDASAADARRAVALYLPRLNGFGRID